jgi:ADP-heptose:LPS heptosyltransferase
MGILSMRDRGVSPLSLASSSSEQQQQDRAGTALERTGKMPVPRFAAWPVPLAWRKQARAALKELGLPASRPIVIHVGAGAREKCWPLENFISLGWQLVSQDSRRAPVVFVLGPAELERLDKPLLAELRKNFPVLEEPPLETLAGVLATCRTYIGNDSGVSHLAAAVGAPTLALFGPTNPRHFAPLGPSVKIVAAENMRAISVQRVWDEVGNVERGE